MMCGMPHLAIDALDAGLEHVRDSPKDDGTVELIVRRPAVDEREVLAEATLDLHVGLVGDNWQRRGSRGTPDGAPHPDRQLTLMNNRAALLVAGDPERRQLAGDQLYVDLDLSPANLPAGTRLALGSAVIEVTEPPHLGCAKFAARFGEDAWRFVNSRVGRELRLRGLNARVIVPGIVRAGDRIGRIGGEPGDEHRVRFRRT
jgi:MOSC domain-containing protein YiiM